MVAAVRAKHRLLTLVTRRRPERARGRAGIAHAYQVWPLAARWLAPIDATPRAQVKKVAKPNAKAATGKAKTLKFTIDCAQPVDDGIMDAAAFVRARRRPRASPPPRAARLVRLASAV
jgi:hypothetical protein